MGEIKLYNAGYEAELNGEDTPDAALAFNPHNPKSVKATRQAIQQRYGVDLGPLLGPQTSWLGRLLGRRPAQRGLSAILSN